MADSFEDLKVGDEVAVFMGGGRRFYTIHQVSRVTKTQVEVQWTMFRKKDGQAVGGQRLFLSRVTDEIREEVARRGLRAEAKTYLVELEGYANEDDIIKALPHLREAVRAITEDK